MSMELCQDTSIKMFFPDQYCGPYDDDEDSLNYSTSSPSSSVFGAEFRRQRKTAQLVFGGDSNESDKDGRHRRKWSHQASFDMKVMANMFREREAFVARVHQRTPIPTQMPTIFRNIETGLFNFIHTKPARSFFAMWVMFSLELLSVVLYIIESEVSVNWSLAQPLSYSNQDGFYSVQCILSFVFTISWIVWIVVCHFSLRSFISTYTLLCCLTCFPQNIEAVASLSSFSRRTAYLPHFLRIWSSYGYLKAAFAVPKVGFFRPSDRMLLEIVWVIICIFVTFTASICVSKSFQGQFTDWIQGMYFVLVTLASVGYGDIVPENAISKGIVILTLVVTVGYVPRLIQDMDQVVSLRKRETTFSSKQYKHVVLCGHRINAASMTTFLNEFVSGAKKHSNMRVIFLAATEYDVQCNVVAKDPRWSHRVKMFTGEPKNLEDLARVT
eukprot:PhF_6_TR35747/c0_g1_i1/m.51913